MWVEVVVEVVVDVVVDVVVEVVVDTGWRIFECGGKIKEGGTSAEKGLFDDRMFLAWHMIGNDYAEYKNAAAYQKKAGWSRCLRRQGCDAAELPRQCGPGKSDINCKHGARWTYITNRRDFSDLW